MSEMSTLSCSNCGAQLKYSPGTTNLKCSHCGIENIIQSAVPVLESEPEYIVPIAIDEKTLRRSVQTFMASGKLTPDDLLDTATFTKIDIFYLPAYLFNGSYQATWTASFGYDRQEHYTDYENRYDSDLKRSVRVAVTKTKTVTDWSPVNGADTGTFNLSAYAGTKQPSSVAQLVQDMTWSDGKEFDNSFLAGFRAEEIEKSDDAVYQESVSGRVNAIIESGVKSHAQGDRQKDWNWKASIQKSSTSYFLPVGWVKYEYGGKEYNYWLDGISSSSHVADKLPVDSKRRMALILGYLPAAFGATAYMFIDPEFSSLAGILAATGLIYAGLRHWSILNFSKRRRESTLARKIAEEGGQAELSDQQQTALTTAYSDVKPGFLASTARDKVLIPALSGSIFVLSFMPMLFSSSGSSSTGSETTATRYEPPPTNPRSEQSASATPPNTSQPDPVVSAASSVNPQAAQAYDLEKGSNERKIILDTVRPMVERLLNPPVTFQVETIRVAGDYAFLRMTPIRPTGDEIDTATTNLKNKNSGVLTQIVLQKNGGNWTLLDGDIGSSNQWGTKHCSSVPSGLIDVCR